GGQLVEAGVEGDGETAGRVVGSGEGFGDGLRAAVAGIPGFEDGVGVLLGPGDCEGGAVHEDYDEGFAGGFGGFKELLLGGGQGDVGAVASGEARDVHGHLFAFEVGREADEGENYIGLLDDVEGLVTEGLDGCGPLE